MQGASTTRTRRRVLEVWWLVAISTVLLLVLATSGPALATLPGNQLNQKLPIAADAAKYQGSIEECDGTPAGTAVWHFVLTRTSASSATLEVTINGATTQYPSDVSAGGTLHWYITTSSPATLTAASTNASGKRLNLSGICDGGPGAPSVQPTPTFDFETGEPEPTPTFDFETGEPPSPEPTATFDLETAFP